MKKGCICLFCTMLVMGLALNAVAESYSGKKILYIDSYHQGYAWSDGITAGVRAALDGTGVTLKIIYMDTKRNKDEAFKKQAAQEAKKVIQSFQPDVVIAADDNASKYLIVPYYKGTDLPFVFCGVNWDASEYGFPCKNVTGMIEVSPVPQLLEQLRKISPGKKVGYLAADVLTARKEGTQYKKVFGIDLVERYVSSYSQWENQFKEIQKSVDLLIVGNVAGIENWNKEKAQDYAEAHTTIPTGTIYDFLAPYSLVAYAKVAKEQGYWAGKTALKILGGASPENIPVSKNTEGELIINARVAESISGDIPYDLIESASKIIE